MNHSEDCEFRTDLCVLMAFITVSKHIPQARNPQIGLCHSTTSTLYSQLQLAVLWPSRYLMCQVITSLLMTDDVYPGSYFGSH